MKSNNSHKNGKSFSQHIMRKMSCNFCTEISYGKKSCGNDQPNRDVFHRNFPRTIVLDHPKQSNRQNQCNK